MSLLEVVGMEMCTRYEIYQVLQVFEVGITLRVYFI